ncbi:MAG: Ppx/GppA family phosphatase [Bacteroidetes bacterium]|nr:Ppx/GppA family phosphatase [Bacteroidota bacterium]
MKNNILAAIDIGTNSFHLIVAEILSDGNFNIIDREKEVIRLNEGSKFDIKQICPEATERAIKTIRRFNGIAESHEAKIRALATSAVRESRNKHDFIEKVFNETGVEIEVIDGLEEARLIYLGILKAVPVFTKKVLCIDIGGGSTEFLIGYRGNVLYSNSLKLGAVRLTQKFFPDYKITKERIQECTEWVAGEISPVIEQIKKIGYEQCIGTSGTIMSAGIMILSKQKMQIPKSNILNNHVVSFNELDDIYKFVLEHTTFSARKKIKGLDPKRADIIQAGMIIFRTILKNLLLDKFTISGYSLREGIVIDTLQKEQNDKALPKLRDIRYESVKHLADISNFDQKHCEHVSNLSLQLFDQLAHLHGLNNSHREYLEAAALLHDIGYHIGHARHHIHSHYIIKNSELLGFNEKEKTIIANVARYHRKSHPKPSHTDYMELSSLSRIVVDNLSAILRIADSLDRRHKKNIHKISVEVLNSDVILHLDYEGEPPDVELWNLGRRQGMFEEVFKKNIVVRT